MNQPANAKIAAVVDECHDWRIEIDSEGIAWLCIDKQDASTNVLSTDLLIEFERLVEALAADCPRGLVIYSGKDTGFIAGADINEFPKIDNETDARDLMMRGHAILDRLEQLPCPTVAAIDGFALGGGLELALACDWRVAVDEDRLTLGFPEVQLGLHPGFGGTVRAVRLLGVRQAMWLMLAGKSITARRAKRVGLIDKLATKEDWRSIAAALATRKPSPRRLPLIDRLLNLGPMRPLAAGTFRATVKKRVVEEHYPAPFAIVRLWKEFGAVGAAAYAAEARSFGRLIETDTSRNLVRVYFLQERLKHTATPETGEPETRHVHVVGAGIMGGDIAAWCALQGCSVTLQDREMKFIQPALDRAEKLFHKRLSNPDNQRAASERLVADVTGDGVARADLIIEAIFEDREVKQSLYRDLEPRMKNDAILATNTSSIPLEELSPSLENPGRLIGLHFFNPVAKLPLVEVVHGTDSSAKAFESGLAFSRFIGKLPLPCASHPGFLVNRVLAPYLAEALELLREGVSPAEIDRAAVDFGMPMGPIELTDSVGIDVALHVAEILAPVVGRSVAPELEALVAEGRLGRKTGHGFYVYRDGKPVRPPVTVGASEAAMQERLILSLANEAAACLADSVVRDPDLIDAGIIFGTGFAPFRGGPLHYAKSLGIEQVVEALERLAAEHGSRFTPSRGWADVAR